MTGSGHVIIEVTGDKGHVLELLNQISNSNPELWRKVFKRRNRDEYRARAAYKVDLNTDPTENDTDLAERWQ